MRECLTRLPEMSRSPLSVSEYYARVHPEIPKPRSEVFFSTPLNSGRVLDSITRRANHLPLGQRQAKVFELNHQIALGVVAELAEGFQGQRLTLAGCIEQDNKWGHNDFTRFWAYYIAGLDPVSVAQFESMIKDLSVMSQITSAKPTGEKSDREIREKVHEQFLANFSQFLTSGKNGLNPVSTVVLLPGHLESLGCCFERQLAKNLGIPLQEAVFDEKNVGYAEFMNCLLKGLYIDEQSYQAVQSVFGNDILIPTVSGDGKKLICLRNLAEAS